jgi:hypothetical protein
MSNVHMAEKLFHCVRLSDILAAMPPDGDKRTRELVSKVFCPHLAAVGAMYYVPITFLVDVLKGHDRPRMFQATQEALATLSSVHANNGNLKTLMVDLQS